MTQIYGGSLNQNKKIVDYSGVLTGDLRQINIINPNKSKEDTSILFIKDSYANPLTMLIPAFLSNYFF